MHIHTNKQKQRHKQLCWSVYESVQGICALQVNTDWCAGVHAVIHMRWRQQFQYEASPAGRRYKREMILMYEILGSTPHKILHTHACTHTRVHMHTHTHMLANMHTCTHTSHTPHRGCFFSTIFTVKLVETVTSSEQMWTSEHSGIPSYWQQEKVRAISFNVMLIGRLS